MRPSIDIKHFVNADCATANHDGYILTGTTTLNGGAVTVTCDTAAGYTGTPTPATVNCVDPGQWDVTPSGCALGKL